MGLFNKKTDEDFDTPSQLATELDNHKKRFEQGRQNVLDRGAAKVQHLTELEEQVQIELQAHEDLLLKAAA